MQLAFLFRKSKGAISWKKNNFGDKVSKKLKTELKVSVLYFFNNFGCVFPKVTQFFHLKKYRAMKMLAAGL